MKNSIQIIAFTIIAFSNAVLAADENISKNNAGNDDKVKNAKHVSYAEPKLIKLELGGLVGNSKTIQDNIDDDLKIIDSKITNTEIAFVTFVDENLGEKELNFAVSKILNEEKIIIDAKIIESELSHFENYSFVSYADSSLLKSELDLLTTKSNSVEEKIKTDNKVVESKILNYKLKVIKKNKSKKGTIIINSRKY